MKQKLIATYAFAAVFAFSSMALAMAPQGLRLHLDTTFLEIATGETDWDATGDTNDYGGLDIGLGLNRTGIGLGYSLGNGLVLGGKVTMGVVTNDNYPGGEDDSFAFQVLPYVEYVFLSGIVRPFVKGQLGFEGVSDGDDGGGENGYFGLVIGGGGGIHFFPMSNVSIDVGLEINARFGPGYIDPNGPGRLEYSHWRTAFALPLGLSAWF